MPVDPRRREPGADEDEAMANVADVIRKYLRIRAEQALALTLETRQVEVTA